MYTGTSVFKVPEGAACFTKARMYNHQGLPCTQIELQISIFALSTHCQMYIGLPGTGHCMHRPSCCRYCIRICWLAWARNFQLLQCMQ